MHCDWIELPFLLNFRCNALRSQSNSIQFNPIQSNKIFLFPSIFYCKEAWYITIFMYAVKLFGEKCKCAALKKRHTLILFICSLWLWAEKRAHSHNMKLGKCASNEQKATTVINYLFGIWLFLRVWPRLHRIPFSFAMGQFLWSTWVSA